MAICLYSFLLLLLLFCNYNHGSVSVTLLLASVNMGLCSFAVEGTFH